MRGPVLGLALAAVAIATSSGIAVRQPVTLSAGESVVVDEYCVEYVGPFSRTEANRSVAGVEVALMRADCVTALKTMQPRLNRYPHSDQAVATPDVRTGLVDDVYLSLAGLTERGTLVLEVFVFPLMWLLWFGGLLTAFGGAYALRARRRESGSGSASGGGACSRGGLRTFGGAVGAGGGSGFTSGCGSTAFAGSVARGEPPPPRGRATVNPSVTSRSGALGMSRGATTAIPTRSMWPVRETKNELERPASRRERSTMIRSTASFKAPFPPAGRTRTRCGVSPPA